MEDQKNNWYRVAGKSEELNKLLMDEDLSYMKIVEYSTEHNTDFEKLAYQNGISSEDIYR